MSLTTSAGLAKPAKPAADHPRSGTNLTTPRAGSTGWACAEFNSRSAGYGTNTITSPRCLYCSPRQMIGSFWVWANAVKPRPARRASGRSEDEGEPGCRTYMNLGAVSIVHARVKRTIPPYLRRTTPPLTHDLDLVGPIELQLDARLRIPPPQQPCRTWTKRGRLPTSRRVRFALVYAN
jgi:hypothetical protein